MGRGRSDPCVSARGPRICACIAAGQMLTALPALTSLPLKSRLFIEIENEAMRQRERERERGGLLKLKSFHLQHLNRVHFCAVFSYNGLLASAFVWPSTAGIITCGTIVACTSLKDTWKLRGGLRSLKSS